MPLTSPEALSPSKRRLEGEENGAPALTHGHRRKKLRLLNDSRDEGNGSIVNIDPSAAGTNHGSKSKGADYPQKPRIGHEGQNRLDKFGQDQGAVQLQLNHEAGISAPHPAHGQAEGIRTTTDTTREVDDRHGEAVADKEDISTQDTSMQEVSRRAWAVSESIGGKYLEVDPVFAGDDQYLILTLGKSLQVFSATTSHLIRALPVEKSELITSYVLSPIDSEHVYASTGSGYIYEWDWKTGEQCRKWQTKENIIELAACSFSTDNPSSTILFSLHRIQGSIIRAHDLNGQRKESAVLKTSNRISALKVAESGRVLVAIAGERLMIGHTGNAEKGSRDSISFTFREVTLPAWMCSIHLRERSHFAKVARRQSQGALSAMSLDVALGSRDGAILVYEDILNNLISKENPSRSAKGTEIVSRRLHWHRGSVNTLKWSADGNYLISGGSETVLVLWQLDTGKRQFLPHLAAAICNLVVSSAGSSYAVRLSDNSTMVLSTTELLPTTSISGLQARTIVKPVSFVKFPSSTSPKSVADSSIHRTSRIIPATLNPSNPVQLLLAVPTSQRPSQSDLTLPSVSLLQTFDLDSNHHVSRQALTRTNTTILQVGPGGITIAEPDIKHLRISCDGQWLATVDEWIQPRQDAVAFHALDNGLDSSLHNRSEVCLKIWSWNASSKEWELVARIDSPHSRTRGSSGKVMDLVSRPDRVGFATVGSDGTVRSWMPATKYRNGLAVKDKLGRKLESWNCMHTVRLENFSADQEHHTAATSRLAFSDDGSVLAVSWKRHLEDSAGLVYFINTSVGEIRFTRDGLYSDSPVGLGFIDRFLILLFDQLRIWDTVDEKLMFAVSLKLPSIGGALSWAALTHLAVNPKDRTFAIAFPLEKNQESATEQQYNSWSRSQVAVFDPESPTPIFHTVSPQLITTLLPLAGSRGYITIDAEAEIRYVRPTGNTRLSISHVPEIVDKPLMGLENIFGTSKLQNNNTSPNGNGLEDAVAEQAGLEYGRMLIDPVRIGHDDDDDDDLVIQRKQLAEVFDVGPSFAMPPVSELFEQVAMLFSGRDVAVR